MKMVTDFMIRNVVTCSVDTNLAEVGALMRQHDCGALPVLDKESRVVGLITDRDICTALTTRNIRASDLSAKEVMSKHLYVCYEDSTVGDVLTIMQLDKVRRIMVVDRGYRLKGIITLSDILMNLDDTSGAVSVLKSIYQDIHPTALIDAM